GRLAKLPRHPAGAGYPLQGGDQRLDRYEPRQRPDPRMAAGGPGEIRRLARPDPINAELLKSRRTMPGWASVGVSIGPPAGFPPDGCAPSGARLRPPNAIAGGFGVRQSAGRGG